MDITLRLCTVGFLFRLRHSGRLVPTDCFGTILVWFPDASNDNIGDETPTIGGTISVTKSWPMAAAF